MMKKKTGLYFILLILLSGLLNEAVAQPFLLQSKGQAKPFSLNIYYGSGGKGAFVQYSGHKGIIPLTIKSCVTDTSDGNRFTSYIWNEVLEGKITGTYGLTEGLRTIEDAWYVRGRDQKKFILEHIEAPGKYDGVDQYLLHGTRIAFNHFYSDTLIFRYPDKSVHIIELPEIVQSGGARQSHIGDYNFDGYDDVAFSVSDAGMGVYQEFQIYVYDPVQKQFYRMKEPDYTKKSHCACLCDVRLDARKKELSTACRGGARWWRDVWKYKGRKLIYVRSEEVND
ncbi:hypothetical protein DBR32_02965 [Taibaiella sp. KBW10]|uniref:XAC2610-related protein n=1 Tax=Taibaiella sp. KBW10 TaxID=2153357 RepID=UPI000F5A4343|nr:hypothetical protein [Taibaiella sp. KBW10]RQO32573.1 hypothetical protein DBR32_02965 [Taibaiella sp. KBW10]